MPTWSGIEDASPIAEKVWFSRLNEGDPWTPLRRTDSIRLNNNNHNNNRSTCTSGNGEGKGEVLIECGRATADPENKVIAYNFFNAPQRELCSAIWFLAESGGGGGGGEKDDTRKNKNNLTPIHSEKDQAIIEDLYQKAVNGSTSLQDVKTVLQEEADLVDDEKHKIIIVKDGNSLRLRKKPKAVISLGAVMDLQRGYGEYVVEGEEEEIALGPVRHLSFVIHGIGEAMWKREDVHITGTIEAVEQMRNTMNKKSYETWKQECQRCKHRKEPIPEPPNRIELIPIEWYDKIHSKSSTLKNQLLSTTLRTIPKLRAIANDVVFDILMYMTPEFCEQVLNCVTDQIVNQYTLFNAIHGDFVHEGSVSLIGHSLGSVITWDMLSLLGDKLKQQSTVMGSGTADDPIEIILGDKERKSYKLPQPTSEQATGAYKAYASASTEDGNGDSDTDPGDGQTKNAGTWGPSLEKGVKQTLPFVPKFTFFLGSPLGLFLTLRGARPLFDEMRMRQVHGAENKGSGENNNTEIEEEKEDISPFSLPSGAIYNIFHPSDPVAYRIEPLLMPLDFDDSDLPPPSFVVLDGQGVRFHVKAKEIGDTVFKSISGMFKATGNSFRLPDVKSSASKESSTSEVAKKKRDKGVTNWNFQLGGKSDRVDFQLQPGRLDNEYLSAISAHSNYWVNNDLIDFLVQCARSH